MVQVIMVNDVLDGHVVLDVECLDRIYLNAYVPILQTSSQVAFLPGIWGFPFPSPALFRQMGDRFRKAVVSFSDANDIRGSSSIRTSPSWEFQRVWTASRARPLPGRRGGCSSRPTGG